MSTVGDAAGLRRELDRRREAVDAELRRIAGMLPADAPVAAAMRYAVETGGKRLRPILCLAAADAIAPADAADGGGRMAAAAAIELVHTYSLVHDDLPCMDDDALRRGRPTTHVVHGTPAAMLAGFALVPFACRLLVEAGHAAGLDPAASARLARELARAAGAVGMVGGQVLDLEAEGMPVAADALRRVHAMKTGALFRAALRIGGRLARGDEPAIDALGNFGDRLGLAFQITDDVLDETRDAAALGKTPGKDRDAHKSTFTSLLGIDAAADAARQEAAAAVAGLASAGLHSPLLEALALFAVERDR